MADEGNDPVVDLIEEINTIVKDNINNENIKAINDNFKSNFDNITILMNKVRNDRTEIEIVLKEECEDSSLRNLLLAKETKRLIDNDFNYQFLLDRELVTCLTALRNILELLAEDAEIPIVKKKLVRKEVAVEEETIEEDVPKEVKHIVDKYNKCLKSNLIDEQKEIELALIYEEAERLGKDKLEIFKREIGDDE